MHGKLLLMEEMLLTCGQACLLSQFLYAMAYPVFSQCSRVMVLLWKTYKQLVSDPPVGSHLQIAFERLSWTKGWMNSYR